MEERKKWHVKLLSAHEHSGIFNFVGIIQQIFSMCNHRRFIVSNHRLNAVAKYCFYVVYEKNTKCGKMQFISMMVNAIFRMENMLLTILQCLK